MFDKTFSNIKNSRQTEKKSILSYNGNKLYNTGNDRAHFDQYKAKTFEKNEAFEI